MESPKSIPQQLSPLGNRGFLTQGMNPQNMTPNMIAPQQMRGSSPSPPYMHQPVINF